MATRKGNTAPIWGYPRAVFMAWAVVNAAVVIVAVVAAVAFW